MAVALLSLTENATRRDMKVEAEGVDEKDKWWFRMFIVYDFISAVCGKEGIQGKRSAQKTFTRVTEVDSEYQKKVTTTN
jgi:hypothetical protein